MPGSVVEISSVRPLSGSTTRAARISDVSSGLGAVEHEVVVVAAAEDDLLRAGVADPLADRVRRREVERRAGHRRDLAGRDRGRVDRRVVGGHQLQLVVVGAAGALAGEVEVGVVGQVDDRRRVGRRVVVDPQLVVVGQGVGDLDLERAGVALLAVRAGVAEPQADAVAVGDLARPPRRLVEALLAAVQVVGAVVERPGSSARRRE